MKYRRFIKPLIITCAVIAALFLVGLIGTPYLIDLGLERWIASQGPEIGQVENIDFNPFTGRLSMDNLVVETQSGRTLNISHAYLQFSWKQLFKKQLYLSELVLRDTFMLVDHLEESGLRVGGLILSELLGSQKKSDAPGWEVGIGVFELQDARIEYDTKEFVATYSIDKYSLSGLETWDKEKPVDMQLAGRINESPIRVKAEVKPLAAVKSWKGNIILENVALELFAKLEGLQKYAPSGALDLDLDLDVQMHEDAAISLAAAGKVTVKQLLGRYEEYRLRQEQIAWQGVN
jgi:autotransporter translocation and assembly factor TamB